MDSARNANICRRFLNGSCRFGPRCYYRHEWPVVPSSQICRYYQKGACWYGERCRYLHVLQPVVGMAGAGRRGTVPSVSFPSEAHSSTDRRGSEPSFLHSNVTSRQECSGSQQTVNALNPQHNTTPDDARTQSQVQTSVEPVQNPEIAQASENQEGSSESEPHEGGAAAASAQSNGGEEEMEAFLQSNNVICGICMEKVYEKENTKDHMFGILPNCNHPFCLQCITTWRKTKDFRPEVVRSCPQCRVRSAFYVPSKYWVEGQAKQSLIDSFKKKFSKKRCCFYDRCGYCPFKTECLYQHIGSFNHVFSYFSEDDDDEDGVDLLGFFLAMTLLGGEDSDDDMPVYIAEDD
ncbi:makorin, ring finger protein, 4 isoform X2 [Nothobranchius furzeri]|uniref:RING-type E3 ubiquitin transferase n=1 Tax=Nothobranchius furzeri TaxID=105023 RepID=A0A9D3BK62_NOTFU|nr:makorin, ring finger protein, 4 isoform X2 [Nothobranchius furzeri]KAF7209738.1 transcript variant X2 [Nothobranchius furzeri]